MKRLLATVSLCCVLSPAWSADLRGKYLYYGVPTCDNYLAELARERKKSSEDLADEEYYRSWMWIAGYLTAYNMNLPDTYDIIGDRSAREQLAVEAYCKEHPANDFVQLMATRTKELY